MPSTIKSGKDAQPNGPNTTSLRLRDGVELLDAIDKLRGLGIDQEVALPQVIVVGQQSSGKSSVLEAISGISFPTNDGLCTRFVTEVVLRRATQKETKIKVQIVRTELGIQQANIDKFNKEVEGISPLNIENIPQIVATAAKYLNLQDGKNFTKNFLRVEVTGPTQDHLTLVDLPGFFHYTRAGQNSDEPKLVRDLALSYMREERSIILAVLSAKSDYSTQEVLEELKSIDATGSRTMGVITGVDLVERKSARESDYVALAENEAIPLALGWHVLRNPSFTERQDLGLDRDTLENTFFDSQEPWCSFDPELRGAKSLKTKLSHVLMDHIGRELDGVVTTLNQKIDECEKTLLKCGDERSTTRQRHIYLSKIGDSYRSLVTAALDGHYEDAFFGKTGQRLRAKVRQETEQFVTRMESEGCRWNIVSRKSQPTFGGIVPTPIANRIGEYFGTDHLGAPSYTITNKDYLLKVHDVIRQHRGRELHGTFDPLLIGVLFKDQSCRWKQLAQDFCQQIAVVLSSFIHSVVVHVTDSMRTRTRLNERLRGNLAVRETQMSARLAELIKPFDKLPPMTDNPRLSKAREKAQIRLEEDEDLDSCVLPAGCDRKACERLIIDMRAYYSIALYTFIDNVVSLGVELCLLDGLQDLFSAVAVSRMDEEEISKLASESPEDLIHRSTTEKRLRNLKDGEKVCQKYFIPGLEADVPDSIFKTPADQRPLPSFAFGRSTTVSPAVNSTQATEKRGSGISTSSTASELSSDANLRPSTPSAATSEITKDRSSTRSASSAAPLFTQAAVPTASNVSPGNTGFLFSRSAGTSPSRGPSVSNHFSSNTAFGGTGATTTVNGNGGFGQSMPKPSAGDRSSPALTKGFGGFGSGQGGAFLAKRNE